MEFPWPPAAMGQGWNLTDASIAIYSYSFRESRSGAIHGGLGKAAMDTTPIMLPGEMRG